MKRKVVLLAVLAVIGTCAFGFAAACGGGDDNSSNVGDSSSSSAELTTPSKIKDIEAREVDLFGEDLLRAEREVEYVLTDYVKDVNSSGVAYELESVSEGVEVGKVKNNKFTVTVSTIGEKSFTLKVSQNGNEIFKLEGKIDVVDNSKYNVQNGGFETGDLSGWTVSENSGYVIAENLVYFDYLDPVPTVNLDGDYYLDGYNQVGGFSGEALKGTLTSSDFTVGGSGFMTFKLGGGAHKSLKVELVEKETNKVIATFNNYLFSDPYRSIGLTEYAYQIPAEYMGKLCFIRLSDQAESGTFKALTADSFRTYYPEGEEPVIDEENIFAAKYSGDILKEQLDLENAGFELPNGDFETGDLSGWWGDSLFAVSNAEDYFGDIFPDNIPTYNKEGDWFVSSESDMNATGTLSSKAFVVTDTNSRWITFRLGGNKTENLYVSLMQYVEGGDDIEIAKFNNNLFSDPYRSFGMTKYAWQIPEEYVGQKLYFVLHDEATSDTPFGVLTADEFKTDYAIGQEPVIDGKTIFPASYCEAVIVGLDEKLGLDTATEELRNGDFETGDMTGWFTLDLEKNYIVTKEGTFFEEYYPINVPQYAVDGNYFLTGCKFNENETGLEAVGSIYSQAFVVGGTGWITFKMGGSNNESLKLQLIRYVENGEHEVIAEFNNYLFSDPYRSMGMTNYAYKIDEKYQGEKCYFKLVDEANTSVSFGAISLDSVKTYYTQEIQLYEGLPVDISNEIDSPKLSDDKNFYPAAYIRLAVEGITEKLGLDTATEQIRNGGFETGDYTGWFTDASGYSAYKISNANTYFDTIFPDNIPVYNKEGEYFLDGYGNEGYTGSIYSQAFKVGGTRWITFRLGGNKTENLKLKLMKYVDGVNDEEIAVFNNYLFSDPYRSFGMTEYGYQIPEQYAGAFCYFVLVDDDSDGGAASGNTFRAMTADAFVTYYETAPTLYYGSASTSDIRDGRIYPAGFMSAS